ncbi:hypothetical protein FMEAI12_3560022 [Parafrankia sp. Ea1.12]|uniref:hypothetical protein n=1 Tax=Parafrankia sp. Ea1.12 TaxID=573499 RepID=UPI000DA4EB6E|nr:hypothetical protein [Parafrankia sp. Ea1.12]SQD96277.1 hypothetical protein FMEAI12_3560022 [Parafrankia sp. Ea1.12]
MHTAPSPGDSVLFRAREWTVTAVRGSRVELETGGYPRQTAGAHPGQLRFVRGATSRWKRPAEPEPFDADAFVRRVIDEAMRSAEQKREADQKLAIMRAHESGHAVVAHVLGMTVTGIVADPDMLRGIGGFGATLTEHYDDEVPPEDLAVQCLAGGAAARMLLPDVPDAGRGCARDEDQAREALGGPIPDALRRRADALVAEHRGAIERVVEALAAHDGPYMIGLDVVDAIEAGRVPAARSAEPRELVPSVYPGRPHRDLDDPAMVSYRRSAGITRDEHRRLLAEAVAEMRATGGARMETRYTPGPIRVERRAAA